MTSPWGRLSQVHGMDPQVSSDGPILWTRPGEQTVPTADMPKAAKTGRRR